MLTLSRLMVRRAPAALVVLAALAVVPSSALAGGPGSTTLLTRPTGLGALTPPSVNDSAGWSIRVAAFFPGTEPAAPQLASADGRYVAFVSDADGMAPDDANGVTNVYVRDRVTQTTILVSRADGPAGAAANGNSDEPAISSDGTHVAFTSQATNLAGPAVDTAGTQQVYVRDLVAGTTALVSRANGAAGQVADTGARDPSISGDGSVVAFDSYATNLAAGTNGNTEVYVRQGTSTAIVSAANGTTTPASSDAFAPSVSDDGYNVAFATFASLDAADSNSTDIYRRTLSNHATVLASRVSNGGAIGNGDSSGPSLSADGQKVAFTSSSTNLDVNDTDGGNDVYLHDFGAGTPTYLISRTGNTRGDAASGYASISLDGTRVAFTTASTNLAGATDTNGVPDLYVRTLTGLIGTSLASRCLSGALLDQPATQGALAPGGNFVIFSTQSDGCSTQDDDDFASVYTRALGLSIGDPLSWVSRPTGTGDFRSGVNASALHGFNRSLDGTTGLSADGRYAVFFSTSDELSDADDNRYSNVFVRDGLTGTTTLVSRADGPDGAAANGPSAPSGRSGLSIGALPSPPSISANGRYVAFASLATNLVAGDGNGHMDVFVRDLQTGHTVLVSRATDGSQTPHDSTQPRLSADGSRFAFVSYGQLDAADPDTDADVYVRDLTTNTTILASRANGVSGADVNNDAYDPAISGDGNRVAFVTLGNNLVPPLLDGNGLSDVYVRDLAAGTTFVGSARTGMLVAGTGSSNGPALDATGQHLAFASAATDLATGLDSNGTYDIFLRDLGAATTALVSRGSSNVAGNDASFRPSISADAGRVAFESAASDLVGGDLNGATDAFVRDVAAGTTTLVSRADGADGAQARIGAGNASISADGHCVAFDSYDDNLVAGTVGTDFTRSFERALDGICGAPPPVAEQPPPPPPGSGVVPDTTAPALSGLALTNRRFRVGRSATALIAATLRKRAPIGTKIKFKLSEAAAVTLAVSRPVKGRLRGKRCITGRAAPRTGKRCTRYLAEGTLRRSAKAGATTVAFSGRIARRALRAGAHRLTVRATDAAGNRSPTARRTFTIVAR